MSTKGPRDCGVFAQRGSPVSLPPWTRPDALRSLLRLCPGRGSVQRTSRSSASKKKQKTSNGNENRRCRGGRRPETGEMAQNGEPEASRLGHAGHGLLLRKPLPPPFLSPCGLVETVWAADLQAAASPRPPPPPPLGPRRARNGPDTPAAVAPAAPPPGPRPCRLSSRPWWHARSDLPATQRGLAQMRPPLWSVVVVVLS